MLLFVLFVFALDWNQNNKLKSDIEDELCRMYVQKGKIVKKDMSEREFSDWLRPSHIRHKCSRPVYFSSLSLSESLSIFSSIVHIINPGRVMNGTPIFSSQHRLLASSFSMQACKQGGMEILWWYRFNGCNLHNRFRFERCWYDDYSKWQQQRGGDGGIWIFYTSSSSSSASSSQ